MTLKSIQKVSRSGNSLMINIPKKIAEILGIKLGDYIQIDFGEVIQGKVKSKKSNKKDKEVKKELERDIKFNNGDLDLPDF